jgi:lipoyl(octanoyl) transferase
MRSFTASRRPETPDEVWLLEHPAVFTLGQAGRREHVLAPGDIPMVATDRGGQVTYHGPGQVVAYVLMDLARCRLGVRELVTTLEASVLDLLASRRLRGELRPGAPGVYLAGAKIASLGLRVRRGCSYHGLALNVDLDLEPFSRINPCGYPGLSVTRLRDHGVPWDTREAADRLYAAIAARLAAAVGK